MPSQPLFVSLLSAKVPRSVPLGTRSVAGSLPPLLLRRPPRLLLALSPTFPRVPPITESLCTFSSYFYVSYQIGCSYHCFVQPSSLVRHDTPTPTSITTVPFTSPPHSLSHPTIPSYSSAIDGEARSVWRPPSREAQLKRLQNETFDLLVIGGGITGVGTALEAASRGLTVALVENGDFANGTSSRSTKLIHGGVRYLEQAFKTLDVSMLHLVREALRERGHMLTSAPHMNTPLPIIIPLHAYWEIPYMWVGVKLYEFFAGRDSQTPPSYFMSKEKVEKEFPLLKTDSMRGAIVYYDGQMNDARHTLEVALTGMQKGAALANYVGVTSLLKRYSPRPSSSSSSSSSSTSSPATDADDVAAGGGRVCGAKVVDRITGKEFDVTARMVVNATGAFGDAIRTMDDPKVCQNA